jgi:predicted Co/Zn/Cd cation transporter (cation efflux family)
MDDPSAPAKMPSPAPTEPGVLRVSIAATAVVAALGIVFGLLSGSYAIVFDGIYSLADGATTLVTLLVANLIAGYNATDASSRRLVEKFTMGFWHLEPMVLGATGLLLSGAAVYAFINAIGSLMSGGRPLQFGQAIVYAAVTVAISLAMAWYGRRANRRLRSDFIAMDVKGWLMSAAITAALLVAFLAGLAIQGTPLEWISPYVDPAVLALVCLAVFPVPLGAVRQALQEILMFTPAELKRHVDAVARQVVERHGFLGHRAYVAKVGRGRQIELYFIAPAGWPARTLEQWDALRDEIGEAIGGDSPDRWLTIAFTTDREWAE